MCTIRFKVLKVLNFYIWFWPFFFVLAARILQEAGDVAKKSNDDQLKPNQDRELIDSDELVSMDYSPAGKTPPIHN